jgi:SAM-dependent methyltransferase
MTDPWPTDAELDAAYAGFYRPPDGRFSGPGDVLLRRSRATLARRIDALAPPGPVLDVGSGDGVLVGALAARGREARGLERGDPDVTQVGGAWAAVVFWHALEHLRNPGAALDAAAALLAPGGMLLVAMPNAASLQARVFGARWFALDLPRHLTHVPAAALRARVEGLGLHVLRESHWRGGQVAFGWLHGLTGGRLYNAIRRPAARSRPMGAGERAAVLAAATLLVPVAAVLGAVEVALRRGGSVYLEARR